MTEIVHKPASRFRIGSILVIVLLVPLALMVRAFDLQVTNKDFLKGQGDARSIRELPVAAHRGMIVDRHGEPLAVSTPVDSVCADPRRFEVTPTQLANLAVALDLKPQQISKLVNKKKKANKSFVYLKRRVIPSQAMKVKALNIPGITLRREYRRYYPAGEVAAHIIGFTDVDDRGQEGIELAYQQWLKGEKGRQVVMTDNLGRVVNYIDLIKPSRDGQDLVLSIDRRLQYLTYRELKRAVFKHKAKSGSAVILDVQTGEVLAMVNQPSFNPNNRSSLKGYRYRNRVVTDTFEPGSTIKPFTILAAMESGKFSASSTIDTSPGYIKVSGSIIKDIKNYGRMSLSKILSKSSNVGASKLALAIKANDLVTLHHRVGFGDLTQSGLSGEVEGSINQPRIWRDIERATLSYGYGLSVTTLQLARAYSVLASGGKLKPVTIELQTSEVEGEQVISAKHARQVNEMLKAVVSEGGTGTKANVPGYHVAGKTGTVKKVGKNGYSDNRYIATFVGMAPAKNPRLVMAITIHEPRGEHYYGGVVAAPVFSNVMAGALRLLDIAPDVLPENQSTFALLGGTK